jgi:DNA-directed RNA polymerase II subunit RPB1
VDEATHKPKFSGLAILSVRRVVVCRNVQVILAILSWQNQCFTLVSTVVVFFSVLVFLISVLGFIVEVKKILECISLNCGKLKADVVSHPYLHLFSGTRSMIPFLYPCC